MSVRADVSTSLHGLLSLAILSSNSTMPDVFCRMLLPPRLYDCLAPRSPVGSILM